MNVDDFMAGAVAGAIVAIFVTIAITQVTARPVCNEAQLHEVATKVSTCKKAGIPDVDCQLQVESAVCE